MPISSPSSPNRPVPPPNPVFGEFASGERCQMIEVKFWNDVFIKISFLWDKD